MNESEAINYVLDGNHPANCVPETCNGFNPEPGNPDFLDFIQNDIPTEWSRFRNICLLWYRKDNGPLEKRHTVTIDCHSRLSSGDLIELIRPRLEGLADCNIRDIECTD